MNEGAKGEWRKNEAMGEVNLTEERESKNGNAGEISSVFERGVTEKFNISKVEYVMNRSISVS